MALPSSIALTTIADDSDIDASPHRNNYAALQTAVNGLITYLSSFAGAVTYRKVTAQAVNTTTAATDLLNGEFTVAAGAMGTNGVLRLSVTGDFLQNSGSFVAPPRFQLVLGSTTLLDTGTPGTAGVSALRGGWELNAKISNLTATTQAVSLSLTMNAQGGTNNSAVAFTTGEGMYIAPGTGSSWFLEAQGVNLTSVDTTGPLVLKLNVINGSASATYETKLLAALVEII